MVAMPSGYYYFGGYDMNAKELTVLMVELGKHPRVTTRRDDLDFLQKSAFNELHKIAYKNINILNARLNQNRIRQILYYGL